MQMETGCMEAQEPGYIQDVILATGSNDPHTDFSAVTVISLGLRPVPRLKRSRRCRRDSSRLQTRAGAMSALIGIAARYSIESGRPVRIDDLIKV